MIEDPIVAEVRRARDEILRKFNYDRRALFEDVRKRQAEGGRQKQNSDGPSGTVTRGGLASWQIRRVTAYIEANLMAAIRLKDFTEITRLSTSHFARAFKASLGESVHGYIIRRRMERAQELMLTTNESLCQIALTCGLSDQAHFSRVFRRVVGVSPNVWRRQWLGHGSAGPAHAARALNG